MKKKTRIPRPTSVDGGVRFDNLFGYYNMMQVFGAFLSAEGLPQKALAFIAERLRAQLTV